MEKRRNNSPLWFKILVLVLLLPLFSWPGIMTDILNGSEERNSATLLVLLFPIYAILSAYYAYRCYDDRRELSWILIGILVLSYIAAFLFLI